MKMRSIKYAIIIGSVIFLLIGGKMLYDYYSWSEDKSTISPKRAMSTNDTLKIIMIGDSWATYHHNNDRILASMIEKELHKPVKVFSSGMIGAKTKTIYNLMFNAASPIGTQSLIDWSPEYCVISAGINDAVAKMGTKNYSYHYCLIIRHLLSAGIKPIVLDMPDIDYKEVYNREFIIANIRHRISSWGTMAPLWSFDDYRTELYSKIYQEKLMNKIIYVSSEKWIPKELKNSQNLYLADHVHLNRIGYFLLDSCITTHICKDYISTHDFQ